MHLHKWWSFSLLRLRNYWQYRVWLLIRWLYSTWLRLWRDGFQELQRQCISFKPRFGCWNLPGYCSRKFPWQVLWRKPLQCLQDYSAMLSYSLRHWWNAHSWHHLHRHREGSQSLDWSWECFKQKAHKILRFLYLRRNRSIRLSAWPSLLLPRKVRLHAIWQQLRH